MEIPGRAPFTEEEDYTPLRKPKSASNTPTHSASNNVSGVSGAYSSTVRNDSFGRTVSPTKLSPYAKEFVPRFGGSNPSNSIQERLEQQQRQYNQQNYQQYQHLRHPQHPHQQHPQHQYTNGYLLNNARPQQQHHGQSSQQQMYALNASVQDRLKIGANKSHGGGNYHMQQQPQQQHYGRNHKPNHHHQQQHYQQNASTSKKGNAANSASDVEAIALEYLKTVIQCLNQNPGQFDGIATRFLTIFDGMENNHYVLSNAMEDIFHESIENPNFRYMGAKLYNLLHMLNLKKDSLFQTLLKCKLDYHQQEVAQYMQSNQQHKVRETALFLAELYMQLRGDDSRIHLIAENIVHSLKQLLLKESPDNIRCICLTLKLAGYDLTADCPAEMQDIILQLEAINVKMPGKYPLAVNVIHLQKNNWGRKISSSNSLSDPMEAIKPVEPLRLSDEPIFYGPDGRELTAEEADFLNGGGANAVSSDDDDDENGDLDVDLDPEMDEETEKAYKEFCKLNQTT